MGQLDETVEMCVDLLQIMKHEQVTFIERSGVIGRVSQQNHSHDTPNNERTLRNMCDEKDKGHLKRNTSPIA